MGTLTFGLVLRDPAAAPAPVSPATPDASPSSGSGDESGGSDAKQEAAPSLDDLLGLEQETDNAAEQAARQNDQELERRLRDAEISDVFVLALEKMQLSADLLEVELNPGLGTQRVQQDVLAKLDQLIDLAQQMSSKQPMPSAGEPSGSKGKPKPKPGQKKTAGQGAQSSQGNQAGQATDPPGGAQGDINTLLEETESEWGHLPARLRDMLEQAQNGYISGLYRKLTEEYYKRLAEEGSS